MDRSWEYGRMASDVRFAWEKLCKVDARLLEMQRGHLAAKVLDLESELLDLHCELIDGASHALQSSAAHQRPDCGHERLFEDDVPF